MNRSGHRTTHTRDPRSGDPRRPPLSQVLGAIRTLWNGLRRRDDDLTPTAEAPRNGQTAPSIVIPRPCPQPDTDCGPSTPDMPLAPSPSAGPKPATIEQAALADLAAAYDGFVEQSLHHWARVCLNAFKSPATTTNVGQLMGWLSRALLNEKTSADQLVLSVLDRHPDGIGAVAHSLRRLHLEAATLQQRIADESVTHQWDFTMTAGDPLADRQQPWGRCQPDQPVQCLVAPGLSLNGRLYRRQRVTTTTPPQNIPL